MNERVYFSYRTTEIKQTQTLQKTDRKKTKRNAMQIHTMLRSVQFLTKVTGKTAKGTSRSSSRAVTHSNFEG